MFEMFKVGHPNDPSKKQIAEARKNREENMQFQKEQNVFGIAASPQSDMVDINEKNERSDLIKWQQDLDPELIDLVYKLRGFVKFGSNWVQPDADSWHPLCNEKFINKVVIPRCKPYLSRNLINSNFTQDIIYFMLQRTADDLANNMADGYDLYAIDFIDFDDVLSTIKDTIIPGAFRALNGWTKKTDSTNFKRIESSLDNPQKEQRKMFGLSGG